MKGAEINLGKWRWGFGIFLVMMMVLGACGTEAPEANGFAIVAVDPATGEVGAAGASCSEYPFDYRAALMPRLGAIAQLGIASPLQRDGASALVEQPQAAPTVVARLVDKANDPDAGLRQYAVVTLREGAAQAKAHLGAQSAEHAAAAKSATGDAVVVGAGMASEEVAARALAAFKQTTPGGLTLADRLMRALEAGSAEGGLTLCNLNGVQQTASTAFLMQARRDDAKFQVNTLGNTAAKEPVPPYLALSVTEPMGGRNAVGLLREQFEGWRAVNLPPCAECAAARIMVPPGGGGATTNARWSENALWLVGGFVLLVIGLTIAFFALRPRGGRSTRTAVE